MTTYNKQTVMETAFADLITKYDQPVPRYTSYPTVPFWDPEMPTAHQWFSIIRDTYHQDPEQGLSLYIHLPFCESLCTYCACNKRITKNHFVEMPYLTAVLKEWDMYVQALGELPLIREVHLGGGTPTFFSAENLRKLIEGIYKKARRSADFTASVEVHPNYTHKAHLATLYALGFRRLSVGVQDFSPEVQFTINRLQSFSDTKKVFDVARSIGYESINVDIIYGLPLQTTLSVRTTIERVNELRPERIAFYSYAHVPWKSKSQRRYDESDLPEGLEKRLLYELGLGGSKRHASPKFYGLHHRPYQSVGGLGSFQHQRCGPGFCAKHQGSRRLPTPDF
jgi:oxygen-independent coproporphyrinogen III oxidase